MIASDAVVSRLIEIVEGCLAADGAARWTVPQVIAGLTALRREVIGNGAGDAPVVSASAASHDILDVDAVAQETIPPVRGAVTAPRRDVEPGIGTEGDGCVRTGTAGASASPSPTAPVPEGDDSAVTYDTLALLTALTRVGVVDVVVATVADVIGHLAVTPLSVLKSCGIAPRMRLALRPLVTPRQAYELVRTGRMISCVVSAQRMVIGAASTRLR